MKHLNLIDNLKEIIIIICKCRYYAICLPLQAGMIWTKSKAGLVCLVSWILSILLTSPGSTLHHTHFSRQYFTFYSLLQVVLYILLTTPGSTLHPTYFSRQYFISYSPLQVVIYILLTTSGSTLHPTHYSRYCFTSYSTLQVLQVVKVLSIQYYLILIVYLVLAMVIYNTSTPPIYTILSTYNCVFSSSNGNLQYINSSNIYNIIYL